MARPHKQTVDYFPHDTDASDGKTLTIIQSKYGNDGYAFWFKVLQLLGKTPGHYYDFNKPAAWEFLLAKTHQNAEKAKGILETLVVLDAIDAELYAHGVIWCQKFVDRVADAYGRTVSGAPQRPGFFHGVFTQLKMVPSGMQFKPFGQSFRPLVGVCAQRTAEISASGPDPDEVVRDYLSGVRTVVIQLKYGITPGKMYRILHSVGVRLRRH